MIVSAGQDPRWRADGGLPAESENGFVCGHCHCGRDKEGDTFRFTGPQAESSAARSLPGDSRNPVGSERAFQSLLVIAVGRAVFTVGFEH